MPWQGRSLGKHIFFCESVWFALSAGSLSWLGLAQGNLSRIKWNWIVATCIITSEKARLSSKTKLKRSQKYPWKSGLFTSTPSTKNMHCTAETCWNGQQAWHMGRRWQKCVSFCWVDLCLGALMLAKYSTLSFQQQPNIVPIELIQKHQENTSPWFEGPPHAALMTHWANNLDTSSLQSSTNKYDGAKN